MKTIRFHATRSHLPALLGMSALVCAVALSGSCSTATAAVRLTPGVPLLVAPGTPSPVRMAVADLQRDLEKVFGRPSPIIADAKELRRPFGHRDPR